MAAKGKRTANGIIIHDPVKAREVKIDPLGRFVGDGRYSRGLKSHKKK